MAVLGLVLGLGMHLKSGKSKYLYLSSSVVILASLIASYARSAWLGFIAMTFFGGLIKGKKYVLYVIAGLILVGAFLFVFHPALIYQHGLLSMIDISENMPYNNLVRIKLWGTALKIVADYPILGVGQGNFTYFFEKYKIPFNYRGIRSLHSDPLTFAVNSGVLGLLGFLSLWGGFIFYSLKVLNHNEDLSQFKKGLIFGGTVAVIGFLIAGLTQSYYSDAEDAILWWIITGLVISAIGDKAKV